MYAKVRDRKTGLSKTVMAKAYQLIPHRYELLGYIDADGNAIEGPVIRTHTVKKRDVAPAAVKAKLTREDLDRMNAEAMERARKNKELLDSLKVVDHVPPALVENIESDVKAMREELDNRIIKEVNKQVAAMPKKQPPAKKRHPSATKVKSVKTIKR